MPNVSLSGSGELTDIRSDKDLISVLFPKSLVSRCVDEPKMIFVNSMSDLFHPDVPDSFIVQVAETCGSLDWHTYQVLTKRPRAAEADAQRTSARSCRRKSHLVGSSVENRKHGVPRIKSLQETPAAVRFLSVEPLLEDVGT